MAFWTTTLLSTVCLIQCSFAGPLRTRASTSYQLLDNLNYTNFFDAFDFFTEDDPTHGYVNYVNRATAEQSDYIVSDPLQNVRIGVDSSEVITDPSVRGRDSIRLSSKRTFTHGLVVADIAHMPAAVCGAWPAFWSFGPNWPNSGEIDIIEGVNTNTMNLMSLHTSDSCTVDDQPQLATVKTQDCYIAAPGQTTNAGCGSTATSTQTYGDGFNANGGGVWVMEWTSEHIKIWLFPHGTEPADLLSDQPDPMANAPAWGVPQAWFQGSCDIDSHFANHNIIVDTTFCGDWAGNDYVWGSLPADNQTGCAVSTGYSSCRSYVAEQPGDFTNAYWEFISLKFFAQLEVASNTTASMPSTTSSASSLSSSTASLSTTNTSSLITSTNSILSSSTTGISSFSGSSSLSASLSSSSFSSSSSFNFSSSSGSSSSSSSASASAGSSSSQFSTRSPASTLPPSSSQISSTTLSVVGTDGPRGGSSSTTTSTPFFTSTTSVSSSSTGSISSILLSSQNSSSSEGPRPGASSEGASGSSEDSKTSSSSAPGSNPSGSGSSMPPNLGSITTSCSSDYGVNSHSTQNIPSSYSDYPFTPGQIIVHVVTTTTYCPWTCIPAGHTFTTVCPTHAANNNTGASGYRTWTETIRHASASSAPDSAISEPDSPPSSSEPIPTDDPAVTIQPPSGMGGPSPPVD